MRLGPCNAMVPLPASGRAARAMMHKTMSGPGPRFSLSLDQGNLISHRVSPASRKVADKPAHHSPMNQAHCCCRSVKFLMGGFSPENVVIIGSVSKYQGQADGRADQQ